MSFVVSLIRFPQKNTGFNNANWSRQRISPISTYGMLWLNAGFRLGGVACPQHAILACRDIISNVAVELCKLLIYSTSSILTKIRNSGGTVGAPGSACFAQRLAHQNVAAAMSLFHQSIGISDNASANDFVQKGFSTDCWEGAGRSLPCTTIKQ